MFDFDVVGYRLEDGIEIISRDCDMEIKTVEATSKRKGKLEEANNLEDARIIKVSKVMDSIEIVYGYF